MPAKPKRAYSMKYEKEQHSSPVFSIYMLDNN